VGAVDVQAARVSKVLIPLPDKPSNDRFLIHSESQYFDQNQPKIAGLIAYEFDKSSTARRRV
jgi:hypothetical protein